MAWSWSLAGAAGTGSAVRRGIRISLIDVAVIGATFAATENWLVPLLQLRCGAAAHLLGYLTSIPWLGMISIGLYARPVIEALGGNRRCVLISNGTQTATLVGMALLTVLPLPQGLALWLGMSFAILFGLIGAIGTPAWQAWMGDLIPRPLMGRYMTLRNRIFLPIKLAWGFAFSRVLEVWDPHHVAYGLTAIFLLAAIARGISTGLMAIQPMPAPRPPWRGPTSGQQSAPLVTFRDFLRGLCRTNMGAWTLSWAALCVGIFVSAPFAASFFITAKDKGGLGLSSASYWWLINVAVLTRVAVLPLVGRAIDLFGPLALVRLGVVCAAISIVPYCLTNSLPALFATEVFGGISFCMVEIAIGVLLFTCNRDPLQRVRLIGYYNVVVGAGVILGTICGQYLLKHLTELPSTSHLLIHHSAFRTLFCAALLLRLPGLVIAMALLPGLRTLSPEETAGLWRLVPGSGLTLTLGRGLMAFFRRFA